MSRPGAERLIQWGILGTGEIANVFASSVCGGDAGRIRAVASRSGERASVFAETHSISSHYEGYSRLLDDPDVDAVYVSLPNSLHVEWTTRALSAGKHVLCEKPMAPTRAEVDAIFDLATARRLQVMEGYMFLHHPLTQQAIQLVRDGGIGELRTIRAWHAFTPEDPVHDIRYSSELWGGALADNGCYCVAGAIVFAGGPPCAIRKAVHRATTGVDETMWALLSFPNGTRATFDCSLAMPESAGLIIVGALGQIELPSPWLPAERPEMYILDLAGKRETVTCDYADSYRLEAENFCAAIQGRASTLMTYDVSHSVAATIEMLNDVVDEHTDVPGSTDDSASRSVAL